MKFTVKNQPFLYTLKRFLKVNCKKLYIISMLCIVLASAGFAATTYCEDLYNQNQNAGDARADQVREAASGMRSAANTMFYKIAYFADDIDDVGNSVKVTLGSSNCKIGNYEISSIGGYGSGVIHDVWKSVASFSVTIAVIMWCISLGTAFINGSAYSEILVKRLIVLIVTYVCIAKSLTVVSAITNAGCDLVDSVVSATQSQTDNAELNIPFNDKKAKESGKYADGSPVISYSGSGKDTTASFSKEGKADDSYSDKVLYGVHCENLAGSGNNPSTATDGSMIGELIKKFNGDGDDKGDRKKLISRVFAQAMNGVKVSVAKIGPNIQFSFGDPMLVILLLLFPLLIRYVCQAFVLVATVSRGVEVLVLSMFAPIPFALVSDSQLGNGAGARYLKNIAALAIQGAIMVGIIVICSSIGAQNLNGLAFDSVPIMDRAAYMLANYDCVWQIIAVQIAEVMLLLKSNSIAQKIMGLA